MKPKNYEKIDIETLKFWKYSSTKDTLKWLEDAIKFTKALDKIKTKVKK